MAWLIHVVQETAGMGAQLGQHVRLQNMKRRHELNGLAGTVVSVGSSGDVVHCGQNTAPQIDRLVNMLLVHVCTLLSSLLIRIRQISLDAFM